ncbi:glycerophosphodiester phosphodiesterase [Arthrobacter sp. SW1]|uniref:glycerophosphodiester phosphodiesterase n=1 Tax=Arthrobacter sp. SW1 TaxID=1920889 RepID=UPI000877B021|nr:glycerophosphodiester phosphodiesterase [Arthrobacter sp. SW1]OFI39158.1 glycerophosphodiester phosphodiesterase [Arthrobacter sp. SW1]
MLPYFLHPNGLNADGSSRPLALAHRGFSLEGLENSAAAFRAAVELGITHLETDARASRDGTVFLFHDDTLDRVTDRRGRISELPAAEISRARIGGLEPIPLLEDILHGFPDARLNIDVKDSNTIAPLAAVIERCGAHDRVLITSFSDSRRRAVLNSLSRRPASSAGIACTAAFALLGPLLPAGWLARVMHDVDALQVPVRYGPLRLVTPGFLARARRHGLQVHVWTVNDPAEMHEMFELGVDGIVTDRADLLRKVLEKRGQWWPSDASDPRDDQERNPNEVS